MYLQTKAADEITLTKCHTHTQHKGNNIAIYNRKASSKYNSTYLHFILNALSQTCQCRGWEFMKLARQADALHSGLSKMMSARGSSIMHYMIN